MKPGKHDGRRFLSFWTPDEANIALFQNWLEHLTKENQPQSSWEFSCAIHACAASIPSKSRINRYTDPLNIKAITESMKRCEIRL